MHAKLIERIHSLNSQNHIRKLYFVRYLLTGFFSCRVRRLWWAIFYYSTHGSTYLDDRFYNYRCASYKIMMARLRSIFANTFPHKPLFPGLSVTDVSAFLLIFYCVHDRVQTRTQVNAPTASCHYMKMAHLVLENFSILKEKFCISKRPCNIYIMFKWSYEIHVRSPLRYLQTRSILPKRQIVVQEAWFHIQILSKRLKCILRPTLKKN